MRAWSTGNQLKKKQYKLERKGQYIQCTLQNKALA